MQNQLVRWLLPGGRDPGAWEAEAFGLRERVVSLEQEVADLEAALEAHQRRLEARIRPLYAELARIEAEIAEARAARDPNDRVLRALAAVAREEAEAAELQAQAALAADRPLPPVTPELAAEYREAARRMHPDHARGEAEARVRHDWMSRLNARYTRRDLPGVIALRLAWEATSVAGRLPPEDHAVWVRETVRRLEETLRRLEARKAEVIASDAYRLMQSAEDAVGLLAAEIQGRIRAASARLDAVRIGATA